MFTMYSCGGSLAAEADSPVERTVPSLPAR